MIKNTKWIKKKGYLLVTCFKIFWLFIDYNCWHQQQSITFIINYNAYKYIMYNSNFKFSLWTLKVKIFVS